jgi:hypothetical protein
VTFLRSLFGLARQKPLAFVLFILGVVLVLGGVAWKLIGLVLGLIRKVPGGGAVAGAVETVARKTGSA